MAPSSFLRCLTGFQEYVYPKIFRLQRRRRQYKLLYSSLAICLILTGLLLFVDSTGGSVDEDDRSTVLSTHDDEETVIVYS